MKKEHTLTGVPSASQAAPASRWGRWLFRLDEQAEERRHEQTHPWYKVLWLTGVDYFSTLGYQPGIALLAAGALSPLATAILLLVTLFGAYPTYAQVARRSYAGQGSIAMLENLLPGWRGKLFVLVLLGFAATDFVITMTLSAADAALHAIENPYLQPYLGHAQLSTTIVLLALLALVFLKGFREAIGLATAVAVPYILLNLIVVIRCLIEVFHHPEVFPQWQASLALKGDWTMLLVSSVIIFPRLALGLSGFETGVTVMPLISGGVQDIGECYPRGRIRATQRLLLAAALIMSFMLLTSSFVTALLIPPEDYAEGGPASGRAIAYLAHRYLGATFGSIYDFSTILILWFAGASAMAALLNLIPRYLPRFGMAPQWVAYARPLVILLFVVDVIVTLVFNADVEAQGGAYATGVLVLILSAAVAVSLAFASERRDEPDRKQARRLFWWEAYFWIVSAVFAFALVDNVIARPDGVIIGSCFIVAIVFLSGLSRYRRSTELRVFDIKLMDEESLRLWPLLKGKTVNLVPLRTSNEAARVRKEREIRKYYSIEGPLAFIHVNLVDDRSEFLARLRVRVRSERDNYVIEVYGAVAIANTIAYLSELIDPKTLFLGLARQNLTVQALKYLFLGEGEVGLMVYTILLRYWESTPEEDVRPLIFLMSE
ncbi:MAG: hypothetical protein RMM98_09305 [Acidobacteriota bacterium]|nr:hypothetical protein [Blastocatellia bacterium]MDW8239801.1 hypothetical protein [Acidobacteriota bacterium]